RDALQDQNGPGLAGRGREHHELPEVADLAVAQRLAPEARDLPGGDGVDHDRDPHRAPACTVRVRVVRVGRVHARTLARRERTSSLPTTRTNASRNMNVPMT